MTTKTVRQIKIEMYLRDIAKIIPLIKKNVKYDKGMSSGINYIQGKLNKIKRTH
jgi:hypothetical protein